MYITRFKITKLVLKSETIKSNDKLHVYNIYIHLQKDQLTQF